MPESAQNLKVENIQQQLKLFRLAYEEMIQIEEFESVKPILLQIRQLEKALADIFIDQSESIFPDMLLDKRAGG